MGESCRMHNHEDGTAVCFIHRVRAALAVVAFVQIKILGGVQVVVYKAGGRKQRWGNVEAGSARATPFRQYYGGSWTTVSSGCYRALPSIFFTRYVLYLSVYC